MKPHRHPINPTLSPNLDFTLFTIPKPFAGQISLLQENAIASWTKLQPQPEILLFGNELGTAKLAQELHLKHIPQIDRNAFDTPVLGNIFQQAHQLATSAILAYINADIILLNDFTIALQQVAAKFPQFLMVGRRWNLDLTTPIEFTNPNWEEHLRFLTLETGILNSIYGMDYFIFPRALFCDLPPFAVGRGGWDNWMIRHALDLQYPVIDASQMIVAIHQNHDYNHLRGGREEAYFGTEAKRNRKLAQYKKGNIADATHYLIPQPLSENPCLSVIIPFDRSPESQQALESTLAQTESPYEVIVVDIGAIGKNRDFLEPWRSKIQYESFPNQGITAACNRGLELASGEFVTFISPKSYLLPNALAKRITYFQERGASVEMLLGAWLKETPVGEKLPPIQPKADLHPFSQWTDGCQGFHIWMLPLLCYYARASAFTCRRNWLQMLGGLDTRLSLETAIVDLILHLSSRGAIASFLEQPTCSFSVEGNQGEDISIAAKDMEIILDKFFTRCGLKAWERPLESQARYNIFVWLAWQMYQQNCPDRAMEYLERSLQYSPNVAPETIANWLKNFRRFSLLEGCPDRLNSFQETIEWQQLVRQTLKIKP